MMRLRKILRRLCALGGDRRGASAVEFALVAPAFLAMIGLVIEGGRMLWTQQTLDEVAFSTARCATIDADTCDTSAKQKQYAIDRAASYALAVTTSDVTITKSTTCNSQSGMNRVEVRHRFDTPFGPLLSAQSGTLVGVGCFPAL